MKPELAQFEQTKQITVVELDMDQPNTPQFKKYAKLMDAPGIPYTVILNPKGEVVFKKVGVLFSDELTAETRKQIK